MRMNAFRLCNVAVRRPARLLGSLASCRRCNLYHTSRGIQHQPQPLGALNRSIKRNMVEAPHTAESNAAGSLKHAVNNVDNDRGILAITWADGETAAFHAVWLRHNCQCPSCITSSNQKTIYPSMLNPKMAITSTNISGLV